MEKLSKDEEESSIPSLRQMNPRFNFYETLYLTPKKALTSFIRSIRPVSKFVNRRIGLVRPFGVFYRVACNKIFVCKKPANQSWAWILKGRKRMRARCLKEKRNRGRGSRSGTGSSRTGENCRGIQSQ